MKAIVFDRYGPPEVLRVADIPKPVPGPGELLIRVRAAEATKSDCEMRQSRFPVKWFWPYLRIATGWRRPTRGRVLGWYFAGEVEAVGGGLTRFKAGDRIFGCTKLHFGAYAQYLVLPAQATLTTMPADLDFADAAAAPLGGLNALHFLRLAKLTAGERVLIIGAGGSIGQFAVMMAKALGARVTVVDKGEKLELLLARGADEALDFTREDCFSRAERYDVVFSTVAHTPCARALALLKRGGRYVAANPTFSDLLRSPFTSLTAGKRLIVALALEKHEELETLRALLESRTIRPIVGHRFAMEQASEAHRLVETEGRQGAVVLMMD